MSRTAHDDLTGGLDAVVAGVSREFPEADTDAAAAMLTLVGAARRVEAWLQATLKPFGLADSSAAVLLALVVNGPPYRMAATRLNETLVITSGGITRTVDRLETAGLVRRVADPEDGRRVLVELTEEGRALAHQVFDALFAAFAGRVRVDDTVVAVLGAFADLPRPR